MEKNLLTKSQLLLLEVEKAVGDIGEEMASALEKTKASDTIPITYQGYYGGVVVSFFDVAIWSSEDDARDFDEDANEYEPLKEYLIRRINGLVWGLVAGVKVLPKSGGKKHE